MLKKLLFATLILANFSAYSQQFPNSIGSSKLPSANGMILDVVDYNNDGFEDVVYQNGLSGNIELYRNLNGEFTAVTNSALLPIIPGVGDGSEGVISFDYNNDGFQDLLIMSSGPTGYMRLFKNNCGVNFIEVTTDVNLPSTPNFIPQYLTKDPMVFISDYDKDNDNDIIFCRDSVSKFWITVLKNNAGSFDLPQNLITSFNSTEIPNIALFDFDNFGGEDILIIKNTGISNSCEMVLYQNNGGGVFTVVSGTTGLTNSSPIGFANILDLNADGYSDILLGTKEVVNPGPGNLGNKIFLNNSGDGTFTDITGLVNTSSSTAGDYTRAHIFDIENDGDQDILWEINSNTLANSVPALMSSNGAGVFSNIASLKIAAASSTSSYTGKYVIFDYNNDGAMDIFQPGSAAGPARLFRNNNVSNKFLGVRLLSCNGQADPIGAKVYVKAGAISTYKSYNTQGITSTTTGKSERLNFGLDTNSVIDSLIVFWPNNNIDILTNISSNQNLTLYDGVCEIGKPLVFDLGADTFNVCGQDTGYVLAPSGYVNYSWSTGELTDLAKITQKGWYFCTVTNVEGCNATDSIFVAFGNASIVQADATICFGDMVTLDANPRYDCSPFGAPKKRPALQGGEDIGPDYIYVGTNNGHHYYKLRNPDNWTQSAKLANDAGGYLAVITSQEEQDFLGNHPDLNGMNLWIGLHKDNSGGQFRWMNCEEFVYNNWATGQSAPTPGVDDNYVYMRNETCSDPRGWKNRDENQSSPDPCESNIFGLVEFDASTNISYLWSTGDTTATIITSPTSTTSVGVRITQNDANCFAFVNVNVINPNDQFASDTLSECKASFIQIQAKPGMSSYSWSTGGSTSSIFVPASGADRWYSVDVVTPEGCIGSDSVYVQLYNTSIKTPDTAVCLGTTVYLRGPNAPYSYSRDYSYNFTSPPFSEFGSNNSILFNGSRVLGPFANDSVTYFMSGLPLHDSIRVTFDLLIHDTWDGNCSVNGPDEFRFKNGATNILNTTFSNTPGCTQNYSSGGGSGTFPATTGAAVTGLPKRCDNNGVTTLYTITKSFSHTAADLDLSWVGLLREATSDICFESWSLDNVIIEVRKPGNLEWSTGDFEQNIFVTPVDPVTEYWVKIPLGNSYCYDTVVVSTFIGQIPGKIFGTDTARYCGSDYANYSLPPNYDKYTWSNGDNNRVSQFYNTGWYTGYIENTTGCYGSDSIYIDLGGATMIPNTDTTVCYGNPLLLRADLNNDCSPFGAPAKSGYTAGSTIPGYTYIGDYRGHSYFLADVNSSWSIAAQNALQAGGYLVNINDTAEQKFIEDNVDRNIWTGLHMGEDGWMVWMNCDTLTYTNWAPGEPTATPNDYVFMSNSTCPEPHKWRAHTDDDQTNPDPCLSNIFGLLEITEYSYVHNWYENFNLISNSDSLWLLPTADARYFGTVATSPGAANCGIGSIVVTVQNEFFDILPDSVEKINCDGDTVMIEAKAGYSNYNWDNGETTQIAVYKDLVGWAYCFYDNGVCQFKDSVYVNVPAKFEGNPSLTDITCFGSNDGVAVAGILGGTFPYDILWAHNGSTQINEPNLGPGVYYYTVTDINGCNITDSVIITNPPSPLNVTFSVLNPVTCNSDTNAMILPIPEGGSPLYSGTWFGLPYTDTLMNVGAGIYNYSVTDSRGCVVSIDYEITQPEKLNLFTTQIKQIFCPEDSNGIVVLNANGGVQPYQFIWGTNLLIGDTAFKVYNGQVLAIVVDQNFCYDTVTFDMQPTNTDPDKCGLVVPSGFTPNGDGMNDLFYIKGLTDFPDNELTVFNRWGETVYHAVNYKNNWDGKPEKNTLLGGNDGIVPNDTYFYIFVTKANNKTHTGYVYITK